MTVFISYFKDTSRFCEMYLTCTIKMNLTEFRAGSIFLRLNTSNIIKANIFFYRSYVIKCYWRSHIFWQLQKYTSNEYKLSFASSHVHSKPLHLTACYIYYILFPPINTNSQWKKTNNIANTSFKCCQCDASC